MPDAQQGRSRARGGGDRLRVQLVGAGRGGDSPQADSKTDPAHRLELLLRACGVVRVQQLELLRPVGSHGLGTNERRCRLVDLAWWMRVVDVRTAVVRCCREFVAEEGDRFSLETRQRGSSRRTSEDAPLLLVNCCLLCGF